MGLLLMHNVWSRSKPVANKTLATAEFSLLLSVNARRMSIRLNGHERTGHPFESTHFRARAIC